MPIQNPRRIPSIDLVGHHPGFVGLTKRNGRFVESPGIAQRARQPIDLLAQKVAISGLALERD
jgi:hypothetical protein